MRGPPVPPIDPPEEGREGDTLAVGRAPARTDRVRRFELQIVEGDHSGVRWASTADQCSIGSHASNDFVIDDATVSRFHCEVTIDARGVRVRDLDSRNGTILDGVGVRDADLREGSLLRLGRTVLRFQFVTAQNVLPISERREFGSLVGTSVAMRTAFALLERAAATDSTVLLEGETGTGKEGAATAIHEASARRDRPFVIVDCGAIPPALLESELFGHEKGAFTGAAGRRVGAFEEAHTGTIFLDEIGELPLDLQPKLLRVLEQRHVRRIGSNSYQPVNVRIVAATNRDLRGEVNAGSFRSDLYYRLAVVKIRLPPLRERPDDIPPLMDRIFATLGASESAVAALMSPEFVASVQRAAWPGNVRELRNYLEQCLVFEQPVPFSETPIDEPAAGGPAVDISLSYAEARRRALDEWEQRYARALLKAHGSAEQAGKAAGIGRAYIYRILGRHRLLGKPRSS